MCSVSKSTVRPKELTGGLPARHEVFRRRFGDWTSSTRPESPVLRDDPCVTQPPYRTPPVTPPVPLITVSLVPLTPGLQPPGRSLSPICPV